MQKGPDEVERVPTELNERGPHPHPQDILRFLKSDGQRVAFDSEPIKPTRPTPSKAMTTPARTEPLPFWGGRQCYACESTKVVGFRDRRPEGGDLEVACERHTDPTIPIVKVCFMCQGPFRTGSVVIDGETAHKKCVEADERGTLNPPIPRERPQPIVVGSDRASAKLCEALVKIVAGAGDVVSARLYAADEGGGWSAVLGNEYAALKVFYHYRYSRVALDLTPSGWVVSVRPPA